MPIACSCNPPPVAPAPSWVEGSEPGDLARLTDTSPGRAASLGSTGGDALRTLRGRASCGTAPADAGGRLVLRGRWWKAEKVGRFFVSRTTSAKELGGGGEAATEEEVVAAADETPLGTPTPSNHKENSSGVCQGRAGGDRGCALVVSSDEESLPSVIVAARTSI
eukprot:CAMPEP_0198335118 /NCGR_PEP_ID=MMETSP1450-20131203/20086_1 /TAXON_ID=753684 ORGANISM="Madagascaria erythrocladiodes, Strain CCMP3234" /NCGR_SAMPLE_ID=MMETSP1450 /ASSEMBLY_ACC=CAM_ASM_001115 /LENGTH=164 /DNA_ID=CAMNT_0044039753 /DNA_START=448 /DNA_END=942 /DNA_ORIENTATION=+